MTDRDVTSSWFLTDNQSYNLQHEITWSHTRHRTDVRPMPRVDLTPTSPPSAERRRPSPTREDDITMTGSRHVLVPLWPRIFNAQQFWLHSLCCTSTWVCTVFHTNGMVNNNSVKAYSKIPYLLFDSVLPSNSVSDLPTCECLIGVGIFETYFHVIEIHK